MCYEHLYFLLQQESFQLEAFKVTLLSIYYYYLSTYYYLYIYYLYIIYMLYSINILLFIYYYYLFIIIMYIFKGTIDGLLGVHMFLKIVCKIFYEYRSMLFSLKSIHVFHQSLKEIYDLLKVKN